MIKKKALHKSSRVVRKNVDRQSMQKRMLPVLGVCIFTLFCFGVAYFTQNNKQTPIDMNQFGEEIIATKTVQEQTTNSGNKVPEYIREYNILPDEEKLARRDIFLKNYKEIGKNQLTKVGDNKYSFNVKTNRDEREILEDHSFRVTGSVVFNITFPSTWTLYMSDHATTNAADREWRNIILRKEQDVIYVTQQYAHPTCDFSGNNRQIYSESAVNCVLISSLEEGMKIFRLGDNSVEDARSGSGRKINPWNEYGVCTTQLSDYARSLVIEHKDNTEDEKLCDPFLSFGSVDYETLSNNVDTFNEFAEIVKSIRIVK